MSCADSSERPGQVVFGFMTPSVHTLEALFAHLSIPQIFAFGINYDTAPLDVREQVSFETVRLVEALRDLVY